MGKPTVRDIARTAGVSLATVDRVLNARPGVREKTIARVQAAIASLGYVRDLSAANLARKRQYRFVFVLPEGPGQFVDTIREALREVIASSHSDRISINTLLVPSHDPHATARAIQRIGLSDVEGVAIMAPETPQVRDAITRLHDAGVAVVALVSDLPSTKRDHFVGIENRAAGRTAAVLMGRFQAHPGAEILVVASSMLARDSIERRLGFDAVMQETFPDIHVLPSVEGHDDPERMASVITAAFETHPDISGIYSLGSGNQALLDAIRPLRSNRALIVVAHELTPRMREALVDGEVDAIITQNVGHLVRSAVRVLKAKCDDADIVESQERIRIDIVLRENLP